MLRIEGNTIYFEDNRQQDFDAIILATGYLHNVESILNRSKDRMADLNNAVSKQSYFGNDGLHFCGLYVSPMGMLRETGNEARKITKVMAAKK
jgi:lysine/ornithine N-monooxygenase